MSDITDIYDWTVFEGTGEFPEMDRPVSSEAYKTMYECSPIFHADKVSKHSTSLTRRWLYLQVQAAYMLLIGEKDLRVVPHYRAFTRILQARGVPCK